MFFTHPSSVVHPGSGGWSVGLNIERVMRLFLCFLLRVPTRIGSLCRYSGIDPVLQLLLCSCIFILTGCCFGFYSLGMSKVSVHALLLSL